MVEYNQAKLKPNVNWLKPRTENTNIHDISSEETISFKLEKKILKGLGPHHFEKRVAGPAVMERLMLWLTDILGNLDFYYLY